MTKNLSKLIIVSLFLLLNWGVKAQGVFWHEDFDTNISIICDTISFSKELPSENLNNIFKNNWVVDKHVVIGTNDCSAYIYLIKL